MRGGFAPSHISLPLSRKIIFTLHDKVLRERGIKGVRMKNSQMQTEPFIYQLAFINRY